MRKALLTFLLAVVAIATQAQTVPTVITEQPEGELRTYARAGSYYYYYLDEPYSQSGKLAQLVFAPDGKTVYLKNPVAGYTRHAAWIEGTLNEAGTKITFPAGQYIYYEEPDPEDEDYEEGDEGWGIQVVYIRDIVVDEWGDAEDYTVDLETPHHLHRQRQHHKPRRHE